MIHAGHHVNLSNLMQVFQEVTDLDRVSNALGMSPEGRSGDGEERLGKLSEFVLLKKPTWKHLGNVLLTHNQMQAVKLANLMEQYVREGKKMSSCDVQCINISYVYTTCEGNTGFHEPEGLRVCSVPTVARALRGWPSGS